MHILDQDEEFHISSFDIETGSDNLVRELGTAFFAREQLQDVMSIFN